MYKLHSKYVEELILNYKVTHTTKRRSSGRHDFEGSKNISEDVCG